MVIIEHNNAIRRLIEHNISNFEPDSQVFITGDDTTALEYLEAQPVDTLLVDTETHSDADFDLIKLAHQISPDTSIILLSTWDEDRLKNKLRRLKLSAIDCVDKSTFLTELLEFDGR